MKIRELLEDTRIDYPIVLDIINDMLEADTPVFFTKKGNGGQLDEISIDADNKKAIFWGETIETAHTKSREFAATLSFDEIESVYHLYEGERLMDGKTVKVFYFRPRESA